MENDLLCKRNIDNKRTDRREVKKFYVKRNCKDFLNEINLKCERKKKKNSTRSRFFIPRRLNVVKSQ